MAHPKRGQRPVGRVTDLLQELWAVTSRLFLGLVAVAVRSLVPGLVGAVLWSMFLHGAQLPTYYSAPRLPPLPLTVKPGC